MNKFISCVGIFFILTGIVEIFGQEEFYGKQEDTCLRQGGLCIKKSECEKFLGKEGELCPEQASQGFQCCYGPPKSDKRCKSRGGECFKKNYCTEKLIYKNANDCSEGQDCCILV